MSFGSAPKAPDPMEVSGDQFKFNETAAAKQNQVNSYNQTNPYGSLTYTKDANSPSGYSVNVALTPEQQALLNTQQATQRTLGTTANQLATNTAGMYSSAPDLGTEAIAKQLNQWQQSYLQPIFNQQSSNLEARLQNQGLTPGSEAYNNAVNLLARNQGDVTNQYLTQNEGQAYNQAVQNYLLPLQVQQSMMSGASPQGPTFQNTPTATVQPPNYSGMAEQNYQNQMAQYQNNQAGMWGIPTALAGGWAKSGFSGLGSIFGGGQAGDPMA